MELGMIRWVLLLQQYKLALFKSFYCIEVSNEPLIGFMS